MFRNIQFKKVFNNLFYQKIQFKNWFKNLNFALFKQSTKYSFNSKTRVSKTTNSNSSAKGLWYLWCPDDSQPFDLITLVKHLSDGERGLWSLWLPSNIFYKLNSKPNLSLHFNYFDKKHQPCLIHNIEKLGSKQKSPNNPCWNLSQLFLQKTPTVSHP